MKKWWFFPLVLGALALVVATANKQDEQTTKVRTAVLRTQTVEQTASCNGVVEAGEVQGVFSSMMCVVDKVLVEQGQQVKAGDPLVTIDKDATKLIQNSTDRVSGALSLLTMEETVCAPTDGIVLSVEVEAGDTLNEQMPCVTLAPLSALQVRVMIREKLLPTLSVGQSVRVSGVGFDKDVYLGELTEIASSASVSSGGEAVVEGVVTLCENEADASMRLGLTAKAKIVTSVTKSGLVVPHEAVCRKDDGTRYVYLVRDSAATLTPITVSAELSDGVLLDTKEYAGYEVILDPEQVSADGMPIHQEAVG